MPRCCQFSEGRGEPGADLMAWVDLRLPAGCGATVKLGDIASAENRTNLGGKKKSFPGVSFSTGF
jgi:hypothetical protein